MTNNQKTFFIALGIWLFIVAQGAFAMWAGGSQWGTDSLGFPLTITLFVATAVAAMYLLKDSL